MKGLTKALLVFLVWGVIIGIGSSGNNNSSNTNRATTTSTLRATVRPTARVTIVPQPTSTPQPEVEVAQKAIDDYYQSLNATFSATETPDPASVSDTERAQARINEILSSIHNPRIEARFATYKYGRGKADTRGQEPDYIGVIGYAAVYENEKLDKSSNFTAIPWTIPVYQKDKQFWQQAGMINHKTMVVVIDQELEKVSKTGYNTRYKGYLHILRLDTYEACYLDVTNFCTKPYWTYDLPAAVEAGYCIATFKQSSNYYPVERSGAKVNLEDGFKVLIPANGTHYYTSPDKNNNSIPGIAFKEWKYGFGGVFVFFNPEDLTLEY